jgi:hypothetical protein
MRDARAGLIGRAGVLAFAVVAALVTAACGSDFGKVLEYEEDITLSLDGSATIYVAASLPGLAALRGLDVSTDPQTAVDRARIRAFYTTPVSRVTTNPTTWRHRGRRFVGIRVQVDNIRLLPRAAPFAWATYVLDREGEAYFYKQVLGAPANKAIGNVGWNGSELVAFRLHLPAKIEYHNAGEANFRRGNILVWEQSLADRRAGVPLVMEARMQAKSILYSTLWLFAISAISALTLVGLIIWWVVKKR